MACTLAFFSHAQAPGYTLTTLSDLGCFLVPTSHAAINSPLGWACRQFTLSVTQEIFIVSLLHAEASSFCLLGVFYPHSQGCPTEAPCTDSSPPQSRCFLLERCKDNSGLGQCCSRGRKGRGSWHRGAILSPGRNVQTLPQPAYPTYEALTQCSTATGWVGSSDSASRQQPGQSQDPGGH